MKIDWKKAMLVFFIVLAIIAVFTFIDSIFHQILPEVQVPSYYFRNKFIYGTLIGFITYLFIERKKPLMKALIFASVVSVLLQFRYAISGYPMSFVIEFLFIHFFILLAVSWTAFHYTGKIHVLKH